MDLGLSGQVALVTGSSRGIGRAIARRLAEEGARVAITGRGAADVASAVADLERIAGRDEVAGLVGDMADPVRLSDVVAEVSARWGRIDVAVASVGSGTGRPLFEAQPDDWIAGLRLNLLAAAELARVVVPPMQARRDGVVLFIASIAGDEALPAPFPYVAAKAGLKAFAKNLARAVAADGVRVNVLSPGNILFPGGSWSAKVERDRDAVMRYIESEVPMKRFGTPDEIADAAAYMCSRRAGFLTGACVVVDGGQTRSY